MGHFSLLNPNPDPQPWWLSSLERSQPLPSRYPLTWQVCRMREPAQSRRAWAPRSYWWADSAASGPGATRCGSDRNSGPWYTQRHIAEEHYTTEAEEKRIKNKPVLRIRSSFKVRSWIRIRINFFADDKPKYMKYEPFRAFIWKLGSGSKWRAGSKSGSGSVTLEQTTTRRSRHSAIHFLHFSYMLELFCS